MIIYASDFSMSGDIDNFSISIEYLINGETKKIDIVKNLYYSMVLVDKVEEYLIILNVKIKGKVEQAKITVSFDRLIKRYQYLKNGGSTFLNFWLLDKDRENLFTS